MALSFLHNFSREVLHFFLPPICTLCHERLEATDEVICERCRGAMEPVLEPFCRRCGQPLPRASDTCALCRKMKAAFDCARSAAIYAGPAEVLVRELKYSERLELAPVMANLLYVAWQRLLAFDRLDAIVPVPLHASRRRERGFNQAEEIAAPLARLFGVPLLAAVVARTRPTETQTALSLPERIANVRDAFEPQPGARDQLLDKSVALVDDVCTTGATGSACAAALKRAGAQRVVLFTFARARMEPKSGR